MSLLVELMREVGVQVPVLALQSVLSNNTTVPDLDNRHLCNQKSSDVE